MHEDCYNVTEAGREKERDTKRVAFKGKTSSK